jgi:hypothetical protein
VSDFSAPAVPLRSTASGRNEGKIQPSFRLELAARSKANGMEKSDSHGYKVIPNSRVFCWNESPWWLLGLSDFSAPAVPLRSTASGRNEGKIQPSFRLRTSASL